MGGGGGGGDSIPYSYAAHQKGLLYYLQTRDNSIIIKNCLSDQKGPKTNTTPSFLLR